MVSGYLIIAVYVPEDEGMLLFLALVIILYHDQGKLLLFEVQLADFGPEEKTYFL